MPDSITQYLDFAHKLVDASGDILCSGLKKPMNIEQKSDTSPVTQIDTEVEEVLHALIEAKFPDHGIVGEEFGNTQENSDFQWVIDPIDGTKSFIAGYHTFTTLIALLHHKKPILGIIDQPILQERWSAMAGEKTFYNNTILPALNSHKGLDQANIATTSTDHFTDNQKHAFKTLSALTANTILGGDAYAYAMLAKGKLDIVVDAGMKPYDFCAFPPIIEGVGGIITDWNGNPLTLSSNGTVLAAASKELYEEALSILQNNI